jgi:hypothetical protein
LLDRLLLEPIEPVTDGFLDNAVTFSQRLELIVLLAADRRRTRS